ncbi:MAG: hypothetical protein RL036_564 [Actinomycetota bacterium]|jgi:hypothetical protein
MPPISALATRAIPADLREKYIEIWQAGHDSDGHEASKAFFTQWQLLSLGLRLRWQADSFRLGRLAVRTLAGLLLAAVYAEFGLVRDILVLLVVWWLIKRADFREAMSKRALKATGLHLCVSVTAFAFGLFTYWFRSGNHLNLVKLLKVAENVGITLVAVSFLTAVAAAIFWLADFLNTTNVLVTGKIFSSIAIALLGVQWLQQSRNTSDLIEPGGWLSSVLLPVSKIQQVTTNLVIPLLICFIAITAIYNGRKSKGTQKPSCQDEVVAGDP